MTGPMNRTGDKADRAYELHLKGVANWQIAERLGISKSHVTKAIQQGQARREKAGDVAE